MLTVRSARSIAAFLFVVAQVLCALGCGDDSTLTESPSDGATRRFDTATSLLEFYNEAYLGRELGGGREVVELYKAETPLQEKLIRLEASNVPYVELQRAFRKQFNDDLVEGDDPEGNVQPAQIISTEPGRAVAEWVDTDGVRHPIHLVERDDGWWISGYTLEYDPGIAAIIPELDDLIRLGAGIERAARETQTRVERGDFASADEARSAWREAVRATRRSDVG